MITLEDQKIALTEAIYKSEVELRVTLWWDTARRGRLKKNIAALRELRASL
jgi:hypothetical protein